MEYVILNLNFTVSRDGFAMSMICEIDAGAPPSGLNAASILAEGGCSLTRITFGTATCTWKSARDFVFTDIVDKMAATTLGLASGRVSSAMRRNVLIPSLSNTDIGSCCPVFSASRGTR